MAEPADYPTFSAEEFQRRRRRVREILDRHDLDAVLVYGDSGTHSHDHVHVHYLSGYMGHGSTYLVFFRERAEPPTLFHGISNHGQYARASSVIEDVRWGRYPMAPTVVDRVTEADLDHARVGLVGIASRTETLVPVEHYRTFHDAFDGALVDLTPEFEQLRYVKTDEEIDFLRRGAELTDRGFEALVEAAEPGATGHDLRAAFEGTLIAGGGEPFVTFIGSGSMTDPVPGACLPWQEASARTVEQGDVVTTEISASYGGYPGQLHRPIAVGAPPSETYHDMFDVVHETYENVLAALEPGNGADEIADAMAPIEDSDFQLYDVNFHGLGMTLQPPFVGTHGEHSKYWPAEDSPTTADWEFEEHHVMTIQPNVVTPDLRYGLQLGTTTVIQANGPEVLHDVPVEFVRA